MCVFLRDGQEQLNPRWMEGWKEVWTDGDPQRIYKRIKMTAPYCSIGEEDDDGSLRSGSNEEGAAVSKWKQQYQVHLFLIYILVN